MNHFPSFLSPVGGGAGIAEYLSPPATCPVNEGYENDVGVEGSYVLASRHDIGSDTARPGVSLYHYGTRVATILYTDPIFAPVLSSVSTTWGFHTGVSGIELFRGFDPPSVLIKVDNLFYKLGVYMTVDESIDGWCNGKFLNTGTSVSSLYGYVWRQSLDFTGWYHRHYGKTFVYSDCFKTNSKVRIL